MAQEKALGNIIGYRGAKLQSSPPGSESAERSRALLLMVLTVCFAATFAKQVGGTVGRVHKGLQNGYRRLTFFCR